MPKENDMKLIQIRCTVQAHIKKVLEDWSRQAGRPEHLQSGILIHRLCTLYEKNPAALVDLGLLARSEHPKLAAELEAAAA